nr:MAG TPA: hypothetical protein [Caudoviricetes sp.]
MALFIKILRIYTVIKLYIKVNVYQKTNTKCTIYVLHIVIYNNKRKECYICQNSNYQ